MIKKLFKELRDTERLFVACATQYPQYSVKHWGYLEMADEKVSKVWEEMKEIPPNLDEYKADDRMAAIIARHGVSLQAATDVDPAAYVSVIEEKRYLINALEGAQNVSEAISARDSDKVRDILSNMSGVAPGALDLSTAGDVNQRFKDEYGGEEKPVLKTGIEAIDRATGGLLLRTNTVLGAIQGHGKTTLAFQIARNVAKKGKVLFYSMDMDTTFLWARTAINELALSFTDFMDDALTDHEMKQVWDSADEMTNNNLYLVDGRKNTSSIWKDVAKYNPKLVVIDHVRYVTDMWGKLNTTERLGYVMQQLSSISDMGPAILTLSQLNRRADNQDKLSLNTLRGSGEIPEDADNVWLLKYNKETGKALLNPAKFRADDPSRDIWMGFDGRSFSSDHSRFDDIPY